MEFALVMPIFLMILMGCLEFGLIMFSYNTALSASRDVTRQLATNRITTDTAPSLALSELPSWIRSNSNVVVNVTETTPSTQSTNVITVDIYFPASIATPSHFLSWAYSSITLHANVSMQQEALP